MYIIYVRYFDITINNNNSRKLCFQKDDQLMIIQFGEHSIAGNYLEQIQIRFTYYELSYSPSLNSICAYTIRT